MRLLRLFYSRRLYSKVEVSLQAINFDKETNSSSMVGISDAFDNCRLDGNIDIGVTCCICQEEITSFVNLTGKRCVWCQRIVHA